MSTDLPSLTAEDFRFRLEESVTSSVSENVGARLFAHYEELVRWAARSSLIGRGEAEAIFERHYAESLAALPLMEGARRALDLGSGAGFPGWVLAAACPKVDYTLVESRTKKAAFLRAASARAGLSCEVVGARVSRRRPLPVGTIDLITVRGVRLGDDLWAGLRGSLTHPARLLRWEGPTSRMAPPGASGSRVIRLAGDRQIQEWLLE